MATYLIGYDLNRSGGDSSYGDLIKAIKEFATWWHHLDSTWIIKSTKTAVEIRDALTPFIDSNDELLVATLTGEAAWHGFNNEASSWLKNNL